MGRAPVSKDKKIEVTALLKDSQSKRTAVKMLVRRETTGLHNLTQFIGQTDSMRLESIQGNPIKYRRCRYRRYRDKGDIDI